MERKIDRLLYDWKTNSDCSVLTICGPSRIGKTYAIDRFGRDHYKEYLRLDLSSNSPDTAIFEEDSDIETLRRIGMVHPEFRMIPGESLILFDNAHHLPKARRMAARISALAKVDVIVAGSLSVFSCEGCEKGAEMCVRMYPMDFEEYLWANGISKDKTKVYRMHVANLRPFSQADFDLLAEMFRRYMLVGGFPGTVASSLAEGGTGHEIKDKKMDILSIIHTRIMGEAPRGIRDKAYDCFVSIPKHLARKNKRFRYVDVSGNRNTGSREYMEAVRWLEEMGVVTVCRNVKDPVAPLRENVGSGFKMYMFDTGLLTGLYEGPIRAAFYNNDLYADGGGAVENGIANMLQMCGYDLHYFERSRRREDGTRDDMKADFLLASEQGMMAVEVRCMPTRSPGSARKFLHDEDYRRYGVGTVVRLEKENIHVDDDGIIHMPLFAAAFFDSMRFRSPEPSTE